MTDEIKTKAVKKPVKKAVKKVAAKKKAPAKMGKPLAFKTVKELQGW